MCIYCTEICILKPYFVSILCTHVFFPQNVVFVGHKLVEGTDPQICAQNINLRVQGSIEMSVIK